jgi:hypothetical protein
VAAHGHRIALATSTDGTIYIVENFASPRTTLSPP